MRGLFSIMMLEIMGVIFIVCIDKVDMGLVEWLEDYFIGIFRL